MWQSQFRLCHTSSSPCWLERGHLCFPTQPLTPGTCQSFQGRPVQVPASPTAAVSPGQCTGRGQRVPSTVCFRLEGFFYPHRCNIASRPKSSLVSGLERCWWPKWRWTASNLQWKFCSWFLILAGTFKPLLLLHWSQLPTLRQKRQTCRAGLWADTCPVCAYEPMGQRMQAGTGKRGTVAPYGCMYGGFQMFFIKLLLIFIIA